MAKYKINVAILARCEYEVEVEASSEHEAENKATGMWRDKLPEDFQVNKGYITDWSLENTEQLTAVCERCNVEYPLLDAVKHPEALQPWQEDQEYCAKCGAEILAEEAAAASAHN